MKIHNNNPENEEENIEISISEKDSELVERLKEVIEKEK